MTTPQRINYFRTFLGWTIGSVWTFSMAFIALCAVGITRSGSAAHSVAKVWSRFLLWLTGIKVHVSGLENVPKDQRILIVSNHQSLCDILVLSGYFPIRFSWIAKKELFKIPIFGPAMKAADYIPIDRGNKEKAYASLKNAAKMMQKHSVLIFPEGTRTRTGRLGRFKHGVVHLADLSGVPLLPLTITNSFARLHPEKKGIVPGTINVQIDPLIPVEGMNKKEITDVIQEIRSKMEERIRAS